MIYDEPFKESKIDDYISARGLTQLAMDHLGKGYSGKELFELASACDSSTIKVFEKFGDILGEGLTKYIEIFQTDIVILGGQISKGYPFFKNSFEKKLPPNILLEVE